MVAFFSFDCGYSSTCQPSQYLWTQGIRVIRRLFVTNYDEDHIADLPMLRQYFRIEILTRNTSVNSAQLSNLKTPPISPAMYELFEMIDSYTGAVSNDQLEPLGIQVQVFHNNYPSFEDTNNLSLLTFLDIGDLSFVLPGDLEQPGWVELLKNPYVCTLLDMSTFLLLRITVERAAIVERFSITVVHRWWSCLMGQFSTTRRKWPVYTDNTPQVDGSMAKCERFLQRETMVAFCGSRS